MVDGVKIDVPNLSGCEWLSNDLLDFYTYTNTKTGELMDGTRVAKYRGLTFIITTSTKYHNIKYCSVRGSLHKYFNNGETNANDFTISQLKTVLMDLFKKFSIDPKTAVLRNAEFGVNIYAPIVAKALINNLVALNGNAFADFKVKGLRIGKGIGKSQYAIKIYDKGKQEGLPLDNLVRIELAVNKMQYLKKYGIERLEDLVNIDKVQPLGGVLVDYWQCAIYYDKQVNWKGLSDFERKKLLYYATPRNWAEFTRKQRLRAKKHFQKIIAGFGATSTHAETTYLIGSKWNDLTAVKCPRFYHDFSQNGSSEMSTFLPLECTGKTYPNHPTRINPKLSKKMTTSKPLKNTSQNVNFCRTCSKDISHKKTSSLYCTKKCNNSYHALQRKKKRHALNFAEKKILNGLTALLPCSNFGLLVEYRTDSGVYADSLYQNEIQTNYAFIRQIIRVTITDKTDMILTSYRAKTLINIINNLNFTQNEITKPKS